MYDGSVKVAYIDNYYNPVACKAQADFSRKRVVYYLVTMLFHVWLLKLLSGNKFNDAFNSMIFYGQHIISKDWRSFIEANLFTILYSSDGFMLFLVITAFQLDKLEEKLRKTKEDGFKFILAELTVLHLIIFIMRLIYPWIFNLFDGIDEILRYEAAHFVIAEGLVYIASSIFCLQNFLERVFGEVPTTHYDQTVGWQNQISN